MERYCTTEAYNARRDTLLSIRVERIIEGKCACGCGVALDAFL